MLKQSALVIASLSVALGAFAQTYQWHSAADVQEGGRGSIVGTVSDINEARNQFTVVPDDDSTGGVLVVADSVTTQFNGFGGVINGKPEIFTGSQGFSNLRASDRVEVRGTATGRATVQAEQITLRGRSVAAPTTGVGQTRPPGRVSTPTQTTVTADRLSRVEGVVRQVNADNNSIVVETDDRTLVTVRGAASTPVYYQNDVYHISNLEVGDRVRVEPDTAASTTGDVRARVIDVIRAVQDRGGATSVGGISGRVSRIDRANDIITIDTGRAQVRVDVANAVDPNGRRVHAGDLQVGDNVQLTGTTNANGDLFVANTVRANENVFAGGSTGTAPYEPQQLGAVTLYATVAQSLSNSPQLVIKDAQSRIYSMYVLEDFVVRTKAGSYTTADKLKEGDPVVVKAYRDADGNYIAQTIRIR